MTKGIVPLTIQEKQPEHPPSQDKPPIQEIKDISDGQHNYLFPMVVEVVALGVEIVGQGGLVGVFLLNQRSILQVAPLGEHVFGAKHTR